MARTIFRVPCQSAEYSLAAINSYLLSEGFHEAAKGTETFWKKGTGAMEASRCIKIETSDNGLVIYGWVMNFALAESELTGIVGLVPKKQLLKTIEHIKTLVK